MHHLASISRFVGEISGRGFDALEGLRLLFVAPPAAEAEGLLSSGDPLDVAEAGKSHAEALEGRGGGRVVGGQLAAADGQGFSQGRLGVTRLYIESMAYGFRDDGYFFLEIRAAFPGFPGWT